MEVQNNTKAKIKRQALGYAQHDLLREPCNKVKSACSGFPSIARIFGHPGRIPVYSMYVNSNCNGFLGSSTVFIRSSMRPEICLHGFLYYELTDVAPSGLKMTAVTCRS